jgi:hypothetical protein
MKLNFPKVRSKIQRAFFTWYAEHQDEFPRPLQLVGRTEGNLLLTMSGLNPVLSINLYSRELNVCVEWQGKGWDMLVAYDADAELSDNGYYDRMTLPEYRVLYDSREALWQKELFEQIFKVGTCGLGVKINR